MGRHRLAHLLAHLSPPATPQAQPHPGPQTPASGGGGQGRPPRFLYYNDAHHFHAKRIEPPCSIHKLQRPVDELVGTGVEYARPPPPPPPTHLAF